MTDPNVLWVLGGVVLMSISAAAVGSFTLLQKRALIGDAVAHAILPGICLAFLLSGGKHPLVLLAGAAATGWLGLVTVEYLTRHTRLKGDAALGLTLSVYYGAGALLLTSIQRSGAGAQAGLDKFLFGKAAAMVREDVLLFAGLSAAVLIVLGWIYKPLTAVIFDRNFALTAGLPVRRLEQALSLLTVFVIALGIQAVGAVLMAALLITPAAAARYWTHDLRRMLVLACGFAAVSAAAGAWMSYLLPRMPTGPWVVLALTLTAGISIAAGSDRGLAAAWQRRQQNRRKIDRENLLKCLYQLGEADGQPEAMRLHSEIAARRDMPPARLRAALHALRGEGLLRQEAGRAGLTRAGAAAGSRVTRLHRLWELYLTTHLDLPPDHVHEEAEAIEHILTPEIEAALESKLNFPSLDPHNSPIPAKRTLP